VGNFSASVVNNTLLPGSGVQYLTGPPSQVRGGGNGIPPVPTFNATVAYPDSLNLFAAAPYAPGSADPLSRLVGMPGWLTQADILEALGPILSARSDTFVIRTYGEVLSPQINQKNILGSIAADPSFVLSRAWCEMVVQRVPDYVATDSKSQNDPSTTSGTGAPNPAGLGAYNGVKDALSPVNATFGRRFRIVSVKWLSPTDI
jgi:hypothetical protein